MAASITFDLDGVPMAVLASQVKFVKQASYAGSTVYYTYFLRFSFKYNGSYRYMTIRLYKETLVTGNYVLSNQSGMTEMDDIKDSGSVYAVAVLDRSEVYKSTSGFTVTISSIGTTVAGTFSGSISFYTTSVSLSGSSIPIGYPAAAVTKVITNGAFSNIPLLT